MSKKSLIITVLLGVIFVAALYLISTQQKASPNNAPQENNVGILVEIDATGGLCPYGGCYSKIEINKNGAYAYKAGGGSEAEGMLSMNDISNLDKLIKNTDFRSIKSKKFTGDCPTAYDGQELTYTFYPMKEIISTCTYAIDSNSPLFNLIEELLSTIYSELQ